MKNADVQRVGVSGELIGKRRELELETGEAHRRLRQSLCQVKNQGFKPGFKTGV